MIHTKIRKTFTQVLAYKINLIINLIINIIKNTDTKTHNKIMILLTHERSVSPVLVALEFLVVSSASINCIDVAVSPVTPWYHDTVDVFSSLPLMISINLSDLM